MKIDFPQATFKLSFICDVTFRHSKANNTSHCINVWIMYFIFKIYITILRSVLGKQNIWMQIILKLDEIKHLSCIRSAVLFSH